MMRKLTLKTLMLVLVFLFASLVTMPARAHGGKPRLEISLERINPGSVIEVRGVEFDYDEPVALSLMRSQIQISLMEVTADGEGVFTQIVTLPADLPPGEYTFRAMSDHHLVMSPTVTVWGAAVQEQEDNAIREQSDVQFGAIPTSIATAPSVSQPVVQSPSQEDQVSNPNWLVFALSVLPVLAAFVFFRFRAVRKA